MNDFVLWSVLVLALAVIVCVTPRYGAIALWRRFGRRDSCRLSERRLRR